MENDLPLFANVDQMLVSNYRLHLACFLHEKVLRGWVTLDLEPQQSHQSPEVFQLILDACDLRVVSVREGDSDEYLCPCQGQEPSVSSGAELQFSVSEWWIKIWKENIFSSANFPRKITIFYETKPSGASLDWVPTQDSR